MWLIFSSSYIGTPFSSKITEATKIARADPVVVVNTQALRKLSPIRGRVYKLIEEGKEGFWKLTDSQTSKTDNEGTHIITRNGKHLVRIIDKNTQIKLSWFKNGKDQRSTTRDKIYLSAAFNYIISTGNTKSLEVNEDLKIDVRGLPILKKGIVGSGSISYNNFIIYKEGFDVIGIPQNIEEKIFKGNNQAIFGKILPAPKAIPLLNTKVSILAHFYNDMGLTSNASNPYKYHGWFDSRMFFQNAQQIDKDFHPYDSSRHPFLGWYKGDDANVLDWQCYWLIKYGVKGIIPSGIITPSNFNNNPKSDLYWLWVLINRTKNFKTLKYVLNLNMSHESSVDKANRQQEFIIDSIVRANKNVFTYNEGKKRFPVFYVWDMESARGLYDKYNGSRNVISRLKILSVKMKALGYDGICIFGRNFIINSQTYSSSQIAELEKAGCKIFGSEYFKIYGNQRFTSYSDYANKSIFPSGEREIINIFTSAESRPPHPSKMKISNSTPEAFSQILKRSINWINQHNKVKILTIYNVGEWAEGGPGLQPNQRDGYKYLEAVKANIENR